MISIHLLALARFYSEVSTSIIIAFLTGTLREALDKFGHELWKHLKGVRCQTHVWIYCFEQTYTKPTHNDCGSFSLPSSSSHTSSHLCDSGSSVQMKNSKTYFLIMAFIFITASPFNLASEYLYANDPVCDVSANKKKQPSAQFWATLQSHKRQSANEEAVIRGEKVMS